MILNQHQKVGIIWFIDTLIQYCQTGNLNLGLIESTA